MNDSSATWDDALSQNQLLQSILLFCHHKILYKDCFFHAQILNLLHNEFLPRHIYVVYDNLVMISISVYVNLIYMNYLDNPIHPQYIFDHSNNIHQNIYHLLIHYLLQSLSIYLLIYQMFHNVLLVFDHNDVPYHH